MGQAETLDSPAKSRMIVTPVDLAKRVDGDEYRRRYLIISRPMNGIMVDRALEAMKGNGWRAEAVEVEMLPDVTYQID